MSAKSSRPRASTSAQFKFCGHPRTPENMKPRSRSSNGVVCLACSRRTSALAKRRERGMPVVYRPVQVDNLEPRANPAGRLHHDLAKFMEMANRVLKKKAA